MRIPPALRLSSGAHWHFIVKQNSQWTTGRYNVHSIRAVLTESTTSQWAHNLRQAACHPVVLPKPLPCCFITNSELLPNRYG